jgi:acetyl esterase/lipase
MTRIDTSTIVYGYVSGASLLADVAVPRAARRIPVVLSVHGGRWFFGTRRDTGAIDVVEWARHGFFAMSIDYRLITCSPAPACYQDFLCAIRWIHANADAHRLDRDRIFPIGMSAGGHMVSLAATLGDGRFPQSGGWEDFSGTFRAAISVSGAYDLVNLDWGAGWCPPGEPFPGAREYASPIRHVGSKNRPLLILHSDDDRSVPIEQAERMVAAMRDVGAPHQFVRFRDKGHLFMPPECVDAALRFIRAHSG